MTIPTSCCKLEPSQNRTEKNAYKTGCSTALDKFISSNEKTIGAIALGFGALEVIHYENLFILFKDFLKRYLSYNYS